MQQNILTRDGYGTHTKNLEPIEIARAHKCQKELLANARSLTAVVGLMGPLTMFYSCYSLTMFLTSIMASKLSERVVTQFQMASLFGSAYTKSSGCFYQN